MKHALSILVIFMFSGLLCAAQSYDYSTESKWSASPKIHPSAGRFDSSSAVGILDYRKIEYIVQDKDAFVKTTVHKIIRINSDRGIEMYNKIYIPVYRNAEITTVRARTISKTGKVTDLPAEKIKEIEDEGRTYKLFAMEGVEKGVEVEYYYESKKQFTSFGTEVFQSQSIPYESVYFLLVTPQHLKFDVKGYNGFSVSTDSVIGGNRIVAGFDKNVEQLEEEKYSMINPYLKRVQYKWSYNLSNTTPLRLNTWKELVKRMFSVYTTYNSKEEKALDNLAKQIDLSNATSEGEKILRIEDYIKTNFNISDKIIGDDANALDKVLKTKNTNKASCIRLFTGLFDRFNINYQIVFPSDREDFPVDEELENWNSIDEVAFFFPATAKYLSPATVELRYPYIPANFTGGTGLFLKTTTIGTFRTAVPSFNKVEMEPFESHAMNMDANIHLNLSNDTLIIQCKQILKGYGANVYRPIYTFLSKERQDELNKQIIQSVGNSNTSDISNISVQNTAFSSYFDNKPLIISATVKNTSMLENAGKKLLFKIGEIIGEQSQMYQEKPRKLPVELQYPHVLERNIEFEIPIGYSIKNPDDLKMDVTYKDGDQVTIGFTSNYTMEGNLLKIQIKEIYRTVYYPVTEFDHFKKVINAAADFNKVTLVLQKN
jgi:hypothetical protein